MPLAVLFDAVGEGAQAPVFALLDLAALALELGGDGVGYGFHLLLSHVVASDEHAFIQWHVWSLWLNRPTMGIAGAPP